LEQDTKPLNVETLDLNGCQGHVFAVTPEGTNSDGGTHIIKLYRPDRNLEASEIRAQYESLTNLHASLNGHICDGWTIRIPAPVFISDMPLALVMTHVPGRKLVACLSASACDAVAGHPAMPGIAAALTTMWTRGQSHGDLTIENILCDESTRSISFVDCGPKSECSAYAIARHWRDLAVHDLAHLLAHEGETLLAAWAGPKSRQQRQLFVESVIRTTLALESSYTARTTFLSALGHCARAHLNEPITLYRRHGLWRALKRNVALRRMSAILSRLEQEIEIDDRPMLEAPSRPAYAVVANAASCCNPPVVGERHERRT
jgi:tRNA A-37 threonylcarbamoyl transferase component Bud32